MDTNEKNLTPESEVSTLRLEVSELEAKVASLTKEVNKAGESLRYNLLKQIEILAVFVLVVALTVTDVIGIGALGNMGFFGFAKINLAYIISVFVMLLGIKYIIVGKNNKQD